MHAGGSEVKSYCRNPERRNKKTGKAGIKSRCFKNPAELPKKDTNLKILLPKAQIPGILTGGF